MDIYASMLCVLVKLAGKPLWPQPYTHTLHHGPSAYHTCMRLHPLLLALHGASSRQPQPQGQRTCRWVHAVAMQFCMQLGRAATWM